MPSVQTAKRKMLSSVKDEKVVSLNDVRSFWVLQLDNSILRALLENNAAHIRPSNAHIEVINQACVSPVSDHQYNFCLKDAGIFLAMNQVKRANAENRQIYYRHAIENKTLRKLAENFTIRDCKWLISTRRRIDTINVLLHYPVTLETLDTALTSIHINASRDQLHAIIAEALEHIDASPYLSACNDCNILKKAVASLNTQAIKKQFSAYLSLIINESALSSYNTEALKSEIRSVKGNPYISTVKFIRKQGEKLHQRRDLLLKQSNTPEQNALLQRMDKVLKSLESPVCQCLMQQQFALEKWANSHTMSDVLHREISALAPKNVLRVDQADRLFEKLQKRSLKQQEFIN